MVLTLPPAYPDPQILRTLHINLKARGYEVDTAADGRTALRTAADRRPDVVILDLGLPTSRRRRR